MTSQKRLILSYSVLAAALAVLFAANLFWGSVALTPQAVLSALAVPGRMHWRLASSPGCGCRVP